ncbi:MULTISPECIES: hypothetical protein [Moorena]|uniref:hypothetical protein n=1 Tax=Moorena TaxID=1155738 RepID=UPI0018EA30EE|nr:MULTISPECIES: hypothetical protein [Moorena]
MNRNVSYQLSAVSYQPSAISYQLSAISRQVSADGLRAQPKACRHATYRCF